MQFAREIECVLNRLMVPVNICFACEVTLYIYFLSCAQVELNEKCEEVNRRLENEIYQQENYSRKMASNFRKLLITNSLNGTMEYDPEVFMPS